MKILIDVTEITPNRLYSSIPIYIIRFLSTIKNQGKDEYVLLINSESKEWFKKKYPEFKLLSFEFKGWNKYWHYNLRFKNTIRKFNVFLRSNEIDVIFIPTDYPYYLQEKLCCKKIVVIHDLKGIKSNPNTINEFIDLYYIKQMYRRHLETADKIIAISKYTKQDIQIHYPQINENKINIVYNSITLAKETVSPKNFTEKKYILYVNTLQRYKNVITLIKAYISISNIIKHKLVIVGKNTTYWNNVVLPIIKEFNIQDKIIHLQGISNEELRFLYENATLFVTSSLNEGFGFTPIEAAICKCPVISSIQEALPDSTQGLLNYYQPAMDEHALAKQIKFILDNPPSNERLVYISNYYKSLYSVENQSNLIINILKETK